MQVLRILIDLHTGEQLDVSSIEVDSEKFHSFSLPAEGSWMGEMVGILYSDDLEVGPTREDLEYSLEDMYLPNLDPSDFIE